jgi:hypothetical protein
MQTKKVQKFIAMQKSMIILIVREKLHGMNPKYGSKLEQ